MKKYWIYIVIVLCLSACKGIKTVHSDMEEEQLGCENEISTAILWVDRKVQSAKQNVIKVQIKLFKIAFFN